MGKKKPPKATVYAEIREGLKRRLDRLAEAREQKLNVLITDAIELLLNRDEPKFGLTSEEED